MDQYHPWIWIPALGGLDRPVSPEEQRLYEVYTKWTGQLRFGRNRACAGLSLGTGTDALPDRLDYIRSARDRVTLPMSIPGAYLSEGETWNQLRKQK
jgi:hypothetical protein